MVKLNELARVLFRAWPVRVIVGLGFLVRGRLFLLIDPFRGIVDLCWIFRVSRITTLRTIAYRRIRSFIGEPEQDENRLVAEFLRSPASSRCKKRFLRSEVDLSPIYRDIIVLKAPKDREKGVLLLAYSQKFELFISIFDLSRIMRDYYIVLEPCWAGYCDTSILMFISMTNEVVVQCPEKDDFDFIAGLKSNLIPVDLGASDWVDLDLFAEPQIVQKDYDLVMVSNWGRHKNHRRLFQALPTVKRRPLNVLLIGFEWAGRTKNDIIQEMQPYDLRRINVEFKEKLPAAKVSEYLNRSKVFLLLSEKEGSNRAIVEALFSNVPAILYEGFVGGAKNKINSQTGVLTSFSELGNKIEFMLESYHRFSPRQWALENSGSKNATRRLNDVLKQIAMAKGEPWSVDIVEKVNTPDLSYRVKDAIPIDRQASCLVDHYLRDGGAGGVSLAAKQLAGRLQ